MPTLFLAASHLHLGVQARGQALGVGLTYVPISEISLQEKDLEVASATLRAFGTHLVRQAWPCLRSAAASLFKSATLASWLQHGVQTSWDAPFGELVRLGPAEQVSNLSPPSAIS